MRRRAVLELQAGIFLGQLGDRGRQLDLILAIFDLDGNAIDPLYLASKLRQTIVPLDSVELAHVPKKPHHAGSNE